MVIIQKNILQVIKAMGKKRNFQMVSGYGIITEINPSSYNEYLKRLPLTLDQGPPHSFSKYRSIILQSHLI